MKNLVVLTSLIDSKARTDEVLVNESTFSEMITEKRNLVVILSFVINHYSKLVY